MFHASRQDQAHSCSFCYSFLLWVSQNAILCIQSLIKDRKAPTRIPFGNFLIKSYRLEKECGLTRFVGGLEKHGALNFLLFFILLPCQNQPGLITTVELSQTMRTPLPLAQPSYHHPWLQEIFVKGPQKAGSSRAMDPCSSLGLNERSNTLRVHVRHTVWDLRCFGVGETISWRFTDWMFRLQNLMLNSGLVSWYQEIHLWEIIRVR